MESRKITFEVDGINCCLGTPFAGQFEDKWGILFTKQINGSDYEIGIQMSEQVAKELLVSLENAVYSFKRTEKKLLAEMGVK